MAGSKVGMLCTLYSYLGMAEGKVDQVMTGVVGIVGLRNAESTKTPIADVSPDKQPSALYR